MLLHIDDLRKQYAEASQNMNYIGAANINGVPHGSTISNPAQQKAMTLCDIENYKKWIMAIEQMESTLSEKRLMFLQYRREAEYESLKSPKQGRNGWVDYVQYHYSDWCFRRYGSKANVIPEQTLREWQSKIVDTVVRIAIHYKCFDF